MSEIGLQVTKKVKHRSKKYRKTLRKIWGRLNGIPAASGHGISREQIRKLISKDDPFVLEIGCNDGTNTQWFLEDFENPTIHCFEPDPRAVRRFKESIGNNKNVTLHEVALSDKQGTIQFHQSDGQLKSSEKLEEGWDQSGSILEPKEHKELFPWCKFESTIEVMTNTLDSFVSEQKIDRIDFVWMDVQGAEFQVLTGAQKTLSKVRYLYTEYSDTELYKGQKDLLSLNKLLKDFKIDHRFHNDVLFSNKIYIPSKLERQ